MVHGRQGLKLEAGKFGVYIFIPIVASLAFNEPKVQQFCADYFQFMKYPANPNTNLKKEFEELQKKRELEIEQRKAYAEQVRLLQESAQERRRRLDEQQDDELVNQGKRSRWWNNWFRYKS